MQEGEMTKLRIKLVQEVSLAQLGRHIKINTYMRLGHWRRKKVMVEIKIL